MIKSESNNTFGEGLMMDMNPLTTPNSVMTNCLNGTLITFNGNEYILLNDMGNGRVETAFLPEGFVPLGTTELGGIIYIVSYNPNTNRCQIGSFPSPERNITSNETENYSSVSLGKSDFGYENDDTGAKVYYLKKNLNSKLTFNPGDKFIIYGDKIEANKDKILGIDYSEKSLKEETIRLYIGTVTSDGKLIIFNDLKRFKIDSDGNEYYIYLYTNNDPSNDSPDLSGYRNLVSEPYNIFNSKVSGELVVIAELVLCTSFEAEISHKFDEYKKYIPDVTFEFNGEYNYLPYGVQCNLLLIGGKDADGNDITLKDNITYTCEAFEKYNNGDSPKSAFTEICHNILNPIIEGETEPTEISKYLLNNYDFSKQLRTPLVLTYEFIPCMNWGPVKYLAVKGQVDLAKLETGIIELNSWKYYNTEKKCNLTWGLDVYEEKDCEVSGVDFKLSRYVSTNKNENGEIVYKKENLLYSIDKKTSYHGTFYETIPLDEEYYKLYELDENNLKGKHSKLMPNSLYLVTIEVKYDRPEGLTNEVKKFYRWLYTNQCFNDYYYKEKDYNSLRLNFNTKVQFSYDTRISPSSDEKYGILRIEESKDTNTNTNNLDSKTSISVSQTVKEVTANCTAKFVLQKDYNSFYLGLYENGAGVDVDTNEATLTVTSDSKYIGKEDPNYKEFLLNNIIEDWDGTVPELPDDPSVAPDELIYGKDSEKKDKYGNGLYITSPEPSITYNLTTNTYSFDLSYKLLQLTKAYCTKKTELLSYSGKFVPLCYDSNSFSNYNLVNDGDKWVPNILGIFSFKEPGGDKGQGYIGSITKEHPTDRAETLYKRLESIDINFGTDSDIVLHEAMNGWKNSAMFVAHYGSRRSDPRLEWNNSMERNPDWINKDTDKVFSVDPNWTGGSSKHLVILMMQSAENDGRYYPINFCMTIGMDNNPANYFKSTGYYSSLYLTFALVLNNIYKYEAKVFSKNFIIPDSIYYGDNYKYNVNIPITITIEDIRNCTVEMRLEDESLIPISKFSELIPVNTEVNTNNITATINNVKDQTTLVILDTNFSSISLRNHIMDEADVTLGNAVYDFDGETIIGELNEEGSSTDLYCRVVSKSGSDVNVKNVVEKASTFIPVLIKYDSNGKALSVKKGSSSKLLYGSNEEDSKQNLTKEFELSLNRCLVIKDPDKIGLSFKRANSGDDGTVTGYQRVGFGKLYKAWK